MSERHKWVSVCALLWIGCAPREQTTVVQLTEAPSQTRDDAPPPPEPGPKPAPSATDEPRERDYDDPAGWHRDEPTARAKELFQEGTEAYSQGDFRKALRAFEAAYDLVPERALLFNMASCELRMHDVVAACGHFRRYVAEGDPKDLRVQEVAAQVATRCGSIP